MAKAVSLLLLGLLGAAFGQSAIASNSTAKELAQICNPQTEADSKAFVEAVINKKTAADEKTSAGANAWLQCEAYMDGFIRGYNMAFQVGMGFTEYHLKQDHGVDVSDSELRTTAAKELGLWFLCLPDPHSADLEAHVVSEYLHAHPDAGPLSENAVKAAFDAAFTNPDGSCKHRL